VVLALALRELLYRKLRRSPRLIALAFRAQDPGQGQLRPANVDGVIAGLRASQQQIQRSVQVSVRGLELLSMPDLPVYLVSGCPNPFAPGEPESFYNRIKGPVLRGLAARAPYFHNGAAANLEELVNFYDQRFSMKVTDEQKSELVASLNSL
jgi:hypothetical protein